MNQGHLSKVWGWLAVASVLFLATTTISLQGGTEFVGRLFGEKADVPMNNAPGIAYFGVIVGGGLFFLASIPFTLHVLRPGKHWAARTPVVWLEGLNTDKWEAKFFQACVLFVLVGAPAAGIVKCCLEAETGDICEQDTSNFYRGAQTTLLWAPVAKDDRQMRLRKADSGEEPCKTGVQLFPRSWTPLFFYFIPVLGLAITALGLVLLFMPRNQESGTTPEIT
ncbi:hypothetical protein QA639_28835 [Bradyrhizobium pachyrhizi]|uniref:hypothetical protein n=1 Tax=Bradyrhizobium pachyrhizi TaxID=280333 RepID=UPI0024B15704|nr:hypothetical protein [Bradyrhizobium pachyrhizi]WFU53647.1 hypothetical protein QA639_28835 [Bradyrhizobium pachyrhizi]